MPVNYNIHLEATLVIYIIIGIYYRINNLWLQLSTFKVRTQGIQQPIQHFILTFVITRTMAEVPAVAGKIYGRRESSKGLLESNVHTADSRLILRT